MCLTTILAVVALLILPWTISIGLAFISMKADKPARKMLGHGFCSSVGCIRCSHHPQDVLLHFNSLFDDTASLQRIKTSLEQKGGSQDGVLLKIDFPESRPIWLEEHLSHDIRGDLLKLREATTDIVADYNEALKFGYLWQRNDEADGSWYTFSLINQGVWQEEQCHVCSKIVVLLHSMSALLTDCAFGNAFISVLSRDSQIAEHRGATNARLRAHIGLEMPADNNSCYMTVGDQMIHWSVGQTFVFDDSYLHSVSSKNCAEERVILSVDLWHPELSKYERNCLSEIYPAA